MPDATGTFCKSCNAKIFFAKTTKNASVPFDAAVQHVYVMDEHGVMQHLGKGHICHFATCPSREQHRKPANVSAVDREKPAASPRAAEPAQGGTLYGLPADAKPDDIFGED